MTMPPAAQIDQFAGTGGEEPVPGAPAGPCTVRASTERKSSCKRLHPRQVPALRHCAVVQSEFLPRNNSASPLCPRLSRAVEEHGVQPLPRSNSAPSLSLSHPLYHVEHGDAEEESVSTGSSTVTKEAPSRLHLASMPIAAPEWRSYAKPTQYPGGQQKMPTQTAKTDDGPQSRSSGCMGGVFRLVSVRIARNLSYS